MTLLTSIGFYRKGLSEILHEEGEGLPDTLPLGGSSLVEIVIDIVKTISTNVIFFFFLAKFNHIPQLLFTMRRLLNQQIRKVTTDQFVTLSSLVPNTMTLVLSRLRR